MNPCIELVFADRVKTVECWRIDEEVIHVAVVFFVGVPGRVRVLRFTVEVDFSVY